MFKKFALCLSLLCLTFASSSHAGTINFANFDANATYSDTGGGFYHSPTYTNGSFTFSPYNSTSLDSWSPSNTFHFYAGPAIFGNDGVTVSSTQLFDLTSTDFAQIQNLPLLFGGTVVGTLADNTTVSQTFTFDNSSAGFHTVNFTGFTNLKSVFFNVLADQLTNFTFTPDAPATPLPKSLYATLALLIPLTVRKPRNRMQT